MYTTAYYSKADWNDTRFLRPDFDKLLLEERAELDQAKRAAMYRDMAIMVRDEGGVILPMFNDFINAMTKNVQGYVHDIGNDMSNGFEATSVWLRLEGRPVGKECVRTVKSRGSPCHQKNKNQEK